MKAQSLVQGIDVIPSQWPRSPIRGQQPIPSLAGRARHDDPCFVNYRLRFGAGLWYAGRAANFLSLSSEVPGRLRGTESRAVFSGILRDSGSRLLSRSRCHEHESGFVPLGSLAFTQIQLRVRSSA